MLIFNQLKTWMYWKAIVRWRQTWGNFKLFHLKNKLVVPLTVIGFKMIGILLMFFLGFGVAFGFEKFISSDSYAFWQVVIFLFIFVDGVFNGIATGRWLSSTKEESWLLASTPIGSIKYLLFLWLDESLWTLRNTFLSNIAGLIGVLLVFPITLPYLVVAFFFAAILQSIISLLTTLLQYYIIKKSVYLKGKGIFAHVIIPLLSIPIIFILTKTFTPWLIRFPVFPKAESLLFDDYMKWLEEGKTLILSLGGELLAVFDQWYYPYSLLAELMVHGDVVVPVIGLGIYIILLLLAMIFLFRVISRKDHVTITKNSQLDDVIARFFLFIGRCLPYREIKEKHVEYYLRSVLQHYLTKRSLFVTLGSATWPVIAFAITFISYVPENLSTTFAFAFSFMLAAYIPYLIIHSVYHKLKIKLAFDSEGKHLQVLMAYGASPEYMYQLKTKIVRILSLPAFSILTLGTFLWMPIPFIIKLIVIILAIAMYVFISQYTILSSLLVPHYDFYNYEQIGNYPDQKRMQQSLNTFIALLISPLIPVTMYILGDINQSVFVLFSVVWIIGGSIFGRLFLNKIMRDRFHHFQIEEISIDRLNTVDSSFWKEKSLLLTFTVSSYVIGIILSLFRQFVLAELLVIFPLIVIQFILISSYNQRRKDYAINAMSSY